MLSASFRTALQRRIGGTVTQTTFSRGFIWAALVSALGVGFPIGAHLTFVMGFGFPIGAGYASFIQTHGHVQLMGWVGLFIMGVSLYFIPRLTGVPMARSWWQPCLVWLMGTGLGIRTIGQAVLAYLHGPLASTVVAWSLVFSGLLEGCAVWGYVAILYTLVRKPTDVRKRPALLSVRPYFGIMVCGWVVYASLNLVLLVNMVLARAVVLHPAWNLWAQQSFLGLVLLPVAFAFSLRLLPLYLRLPVVDWSSQAVAYIYLAVLLIQILPAMPPLLSQAPHVLVGLSQIGTLLKAAVVCWFVWKLDLLSRRPAATVTRALPPGTERRPTRPGLPDSRAFGRFERLIYAAYVWLILAALCEAAAALAWLTGFMPFISSTVILHMYLMGFISQLIFGMAVRLLPGFMHKRRVAHPGLVDMTFWLGNVATVFRVVLFFLPAWLVNLLPGLVVGGRLAFALSGILGLGAVLALAANLWMTSHMESL
jgi:uncharacterized protein involved in response to NO